MTQMATITSKRQLTIPASIFRQLGLQQGQKVVIKVEEGSMKITSAMELLDRLQGSVQVPKEYQGLTEDQMIAKAKNEYFKSK